MRLLLIEDDPMIGEALSLSLKEAAYAVDWVKDGAAAISAIACHTYEAILLDLGLPKKNGFEVLRHTRQSGNTVSVIIMTARDAVEDRIRGLDEGADDYVLKPFDMAELHARIRAVIRRKTGHANPVMSNGPITLNPGTKEVEANGVKVYLTSREFALLQALLQRPGAILSRADLEERIYGWNEEVESNVIEFLIHSLRKKLGPETIKNVRGMGWMVSKLK